MGLVLGVAGGESIARWSLVNHLHARHDHDCTYTMWYSLCSPHCFSTSIFPPSLASCLWNADDVYSPLNILPTLLEAIIMWSFTCSCSMSSLLREFESAWTRRMLFCPIEFSLEHLFIRTRRVSTKESTWTNYVNWSFFLESSQTHVGNVCRIIMNINEMQEQSNSAEAKFFSSTLSAVLLDKMSDINGILYWLKVLWMLPVCNILPGLKIEQDFNHCLNDFLKTATTHNYLSIYYKVPYQGWCDFSLA